MCVNSDIYVYVYVFVCVGDLKWSVPNTENPMYTSVARVNSSRVSSGRVGGRGKRNEYGVGSSSDEMLDEEEGSVLHIF